MKTFQKLIISNFITNFFYNEILDIKNHKDVSFIRRIINWFHIPSIILHEIEHGIVCVLLFAKFNGFIFYLRPRHISNFENSNINFNKKEKEFLNKEEENHKKYRENNYIYLHAFTLIKKQYKNIFSAFFICMAPLFFVILSILLSFAFTPFIYISIYLILTYKTSFPSVKDFEILHRFFSIYIMTYLIISLKTIFSSKKRIKKYCLIA